MKVSIDQAVVARFHMAAGGRLREWIDDHTDEIRAVVRSRIPKAGTEMGKRDVGVKIGMARKDIAAILRGERLIELEKLGAGVAYKAVTKAAALGEFDIHASRAAGDSAGCAYIKQELFGTVASRPADSPEARAAYLSGCARLREIIPAARTVAAVYDLLAAWKQLAADGYGYSHSGGDRRGTRIAETTTRADAEARFGKAAGYSNGQPYVRADREKLKAAGFVDYLTRGEVADLYQAVSAEETEEAKKQATAMGPRFRSAVMRRTEATRYGQTLPTFHDETKKRAEIYEKTDNWSWSDAAEKPDDQPKTRNEFVFVRAGLTGVREGGPVVGKVSGADLQNTFGLRGVEHGLWMGDTDSDTGEKSAYGAFLDLSLLIGVPPALMGFNGRLGLALGARGSGKAAAHYEPGRQVINMTKTKGAGTLAHEWGHAMDHWFADPSGKRGKGTYCSQGERTGEPAVDEAFRAVMLAILGPEGRAEDKRSRRWNSGTNMPGDPPDDWKTTPIVDWNDRNGRVNILNRWEREAREALRKGQSAPVDEDAIAEARADLDARALALMDFNRLEKAWKAGTRAEAKAAQQDRRRITKYLKDAEKLGDYWARPQELFARAWEAWVEDALEARGWQSTYLVTGTRSRYAVVRDPTKPDLSVEPYPQGEERTAINAAMAKLIAVLVGRA